MIDFFEIDERKQTVKILNLDNLSVEDLMKYKEELRIEIDRVDQEIKVKNKVKTDAEKLFK